MISIVPAQQGLAQLASQWNSAASRIARGQCVQPAELQAIANLASSVARLAASAAVAAWIGSGSATAKSHAANAWGAVATAGAAPVGCTLDSPACTNDATAVGCLQAQVQAASYAVSEAQAAVQILAQAPPGRFPIRLVPTPAPPAPPPQGGGIVQ